MLISGSLTFWEFSRQLVIPRMLEGMSVTLQLTLWSGLFGIALGLVSSLARISRNPLIRGVSLVYVTLFRGTPLLLQIFFFYYALPQLIPALRPEAMMAGILALSFNAGAYITEIFRAAIQSIDKGQMEAARSLGMSYGMAMRRIILPQTFRRLIPPIVNELAALSKDTSLLQVISLAEMMYVGQRVAAKYLRFWESYVWAALGYLIIVITLTLLATYLERRLEAREA